MRDKIIKILETEYTKRDLMEKWKTAEEVTDEIMELLKAE